MRAKVIQAVSRVMGVPQEQIDETASPETIEAWDSLKHMNLILALEEEFDVQFADEKIVAMLTVGLILETLREMKT